MARKLSPVVKYAIGGALLIGVFVFFFKQTASAFQPKARGQNNIRLFRGRSNFGGVQNQGGYNNLAGNKTQRHLQNAGTRLMGRS